MEVITLTSPNTLLQPKNFQKSFHNYICDVQSENERCQTPTRITNAIFHLSAFARFSALHCLSMIQGTNYLVMDSMIKLNDYFTDG